MAKVPPTPTRTNGRPARQAKTIPVPRDLAERTLAIVIQHPAAQVYPLIEEWDRLVPGLIQRTPVA